MLYRFENKKVFTRAIEYSVSYHCNLSCSGCSHMSPFINKNTPPLESFSADLKELSKALHAKDLRLVGGEPLLNPQITAFAKEAKKIGIADVVMVTTNGLILHKMDRNFWENVDIVSVTLYPDSLPKEENIEKFKRLASETNTELRLQPSPVFRTTITTEQHPKDCVTDMIFKTCKNAHLYHCHMVHEGRLYKCAVPPFLPEYLSRIGAGCYDPSVDSCDIHGSGDLFEELRDFLTSLKPLDACRYCLGHVGKFQKHHQLEQKFRSNPALQKINRKNSLDRYKFFKETARYYRRRFLERFSGRNQW